MQPAIRTISPDLLSLLQCGEVESAWLLGSAPTVTTGQSAPPAMPAHLIPVPDSLIVTPFQRFIAYTDRRGAVVSLHSVTGLESDALSTEGRVAHVSMGGNRISIHTDGKSGFYARWSTAVAAYHLTYRPTELHDFMNLLLSLDWPTFD